MKCLFGVSPVPSCVKSLGFPDPPFTLSEFTQGEIQKIVDFLNLETPVGIFFDAKVS